MREMVYFLSDGAGEIKIGFTRNLHHRLATLSSSSNKSLAVIGAIQGDRRVERAIHLKLAAHRMRGEWFKDCPETRALIEKLLVHGSDVLGAPPSPELNDNSPEPEPCTTKRSLDEWMVDKNRLVEAADRLVPPDYLFDVELATGFPPFSLWPVSKGPAPDLSLAQHKKQVRAALITALKLEAEYVKSWGDPS